MPVVVGVNVTEIWQEFPADTVAPQLLVSAKSHEMEIFAIFNVARPVFPRVTTCGELVVPTGWEANVREVGVKVT
jgi:hypothetical protein